MVQAAGVDMVIMPAREVEPVRRFLLGSVTAKVLHDVDCPVWTVLQEPRAQHPEDKAEIRHRLRNRSRPCERRHHPLVCGPFQKVQRVTHCRSCQRSARAGDRPRT
jgi:hypothetical protein